MPRHSWSQSWGSLKSKWRTFGIPLRKDINSWIKFEVLVDRQNFCPPSQSIIYWIHTWHDPAALGSNLRNKFRHTRSVQIRAALAFFKEQKIETLKYVKQATWQFLIARCTGKKMLIFLQKQPAQNKCTLPRTNLVPFVHHQAEPTHLQQRHVAAAVRYCVASFMTHPVKKYQRWR